VNPILNPDPHPNQALQMSLKTLGGVASIGVRSSGNLCVDEVFSVCVCVFITAGPCVCVSVLFIGTQFSNLYTAVDTPARGRVGEKMCLLLQELEQSCLRGEVGILEYMCYERQRAEACVD
jgi:hypothetical protein